MLLIRALLKHLGTCELSQYVIVVHNHSSMCSIFYCSAVCSATTCCVIAVVLVLCHVVCALVSLFFLFQVFFGLGLTGIAGGQVSLSSSLVKS